MAKRKSKSSSRLPFGIAGIVIVFVVVYLFTGFPVSLIPVDANVPQEILDDLANAPDFQVPFDCIIAVDCDGIPIECVLATDINCEGGRFEIEPVDPIDDITNNCIQTPIPNTELILEDCIFEPLDPFVNMTVIVDPNDGTFIDPTPETLPELFDLEIRSKVLKIDGTGQIIESITNFDIPLFAFFVEDTTNTDFTNGVLQQELFLVAPPNTRLLLFADFDILIGNKTALVEPLTLGISGVTDGSTGELQIDYINDAGLRSNQFTFQFKDHIDEFPILGTEMVEFVISNVRVTSGDFEFELESEAIYSLAISIDPNRLIITDEFGGKTRIFPTDDTLRVYSSTSTRKVCTTPRRGLRSYCYYVCCYNAPAMGAGSFKHIAQDGTEELLAEWNANGVGGCRAVFKQGIRCDSFGKVNIVIQRDEIYRFDIGSPTPASITFKTPPEHKNFAFYCVGNSNTPLTGLGSCNFLNPTFQQTLRDSLTAEPITFIGAPNG